MTRHFRLFMATVIAVVASGAVAGAQPTRRPLPRVVDSTAVVCLDITWLDAGAICEGRISNVMTSAVFTGLLGGLSGAVGGALAPTACLGGAESAAVRGLAVGAGVGFVAGLLTRQVSRHQLAARLAAEREAARRNPVKPWSWRDVRPVFVVAGGTALGGAAIGALRGGTSSACTDGAGANALRGAAVYGGGTLATVGISLVAVRWLF